MDKFLSESSRAKFSYRLLIATPKAAPRCSTHNQRAGEARRFRGVERSVNCRSQLAHKPSRHALVGTTEGCAAPDKHQRDAVGGVVKGFTTSNRGQLIMACGTGKTLTSLFVREKLSAERTLVLVPSLSLLKQTMQVWDCEQEEAFRGATRLQRIRRSVAPRTTLQSRMPANWAFRLLPIRTKSQRFCGVDLGPRVVFSLTNRPHRSPPPSPSGACLRLISDRR